jgi:hypothetical protein
MDNTISLRGFDNLDPAELQKVEEILSKNIKKIASGEGYDHLSIELKQHKHAKGFNHEIKAVLFLKNQKISSQNQRISSQASDKNLYKSLKIVLDKLLAEIEHNQKHRR